MPRLHGYRERIKVNYYDALFCGGNMPVLPGTQLFGSENIGAQHLTNLRTPGVLESDKMVILSNWYARSSVPASKEWDAITNMMLATLMIGDRIYRTQSVYELLRRPQGVILPSAEELEQKKLERDNRIASIARSTHLEPGQVESVLRQVELTDYLFVPQRQSVYVRIDLYGVDDQLNQMRCRWDEAGALPVAPGLWVHLEGWATRDVV